MFIYKYGEKRVPSFNQMQFLPCPKFADIKMEVDAEYSPLRQMVYKWFSQFKCGHMRICDRERSGQSIQIVINEIFEKIGKLVTCDCRLKESQRNECGLLCIKFWGVREFFVRRVSRLLTDGQKRVRVDAPITGSTFFNQGCYNQGIPGNIGKFQKVRKNLTKNKLLGKMTKITGIIVGLPLIAV